MSVATKTANPEFDAFVAAHPGNDLEVEGVRLHYLDEGHGEPVVMVHGNPTWSFFYRRLVERLSPSFRAIVPDHVGCGLSEKPDDSGYDYTLSRRVSDLEALLDHLDVREKINLIVHDWGGMIGMAYAVSHPDRIARLVVMNTAGFHLPQSKSFPAALWLCRDTPLGAWMVRGLNAFARGTAVIGCTRNRLPRSTRNAYVAPYDSWAHRIAIHRFVQDIPLKPEDRSHHLVSWVQDRLTLLQNKPIFLGWGMKDFVFDRHFLDEWIRRFPNAEVHKFEKAGHYVLEEEAEELIPAIERFLKARPDAARPA